MINVFDREYFFSNYYPAEMIYDGITYQSAEATFQAQKYKDRADRYRLFGLNATRVRKIGREVSLRPDWEAVKVGTMRDIVRAKFADNLELTEKLLATSSEYLEEGNTWGDRV